MPNKIIFFVIAIVMAFGCQTESSPDSVLTEFVKYRFTTHQTRDAMLKFLGGELFDTVSAISKEDFEQMVKVDMYRLKSFKIDHKACSDKLCNITYTLKYDVVDNGKTTVLAEVKKIASLILVDDLWKVSGIENVKTFYDNKEEINL